MYITINRNCAIKYIRENILKGTKMVLDDGGYYHHNTEYKCGISVMNNGILSLKRLNELGIRSDGSLDNFKNEYSHVNGIDGISLSVVGLTDLYKDEDEYNPFNPFFIDFTVSKDICTRRQTRHYGNEFITDNDIPVSEIKTVDFRLMSYIDLPNISVDDVIERYNIMLEIIKLANEKKINISVRDTSAKVKLNSLYNLPYIK